FVLGSFAIGDALHHLRRPLEALARRGRAARCAGPGPHVAPSRARSSQHRPGRASLVVRPQAPGYRIWRWWTNTASVARRLLASVGLREPLDDVLANITSDQAGRDQIVARRDRASHQLSRIGPGGRGVAQRLSITVLIETIPGQIERARVDGRI